MATPTYIPIASTTLATASSSVNFFGIPTQDVDGNDLKDLVLVVEFKGSGGNAYASLRFNGDAGSGNYHIVQAYGTGSAATSSSYSSDKITIHSATTTSAMLDTFQIMDYSATDKHKSVLNRNGRADYRTGMVAARWANTSAIASIEVFALTNSYAAGSTFKLFGIAG